MAALARYFLHLGMRVAGYDLTPTPLTRALETEGAAVHYDDDPALIPGEFRDPASTFVVYTPAVPGDHRELNWFADGGFPIEKRSEMLGPIVAERFTLAVAGTHGKTTTTTLTAWLNHATGVGGSAFLGGISKNFDSNLVLGEGNRLAVEADEFDRSFLRLRPDVAVITSVEPDHLDIYGDFEAVREAFSQFLDQVSPLGIAILHSRVDIAIRNRATLIYRYSMDDPGADFRVENLKPVAGGYYEYDIVVPEGETIAGCRLGIPGRINVENSVAAVALMWAAGQIRGEALDHDKLRAALASFEGVRRRFDVWINTPSGVFIDDYAHHPAELRAAIASIRDMFPGRRLTAIFQPHLYTRTRDLHAEFAEALSKADEVILTPIYPARELPIEGVDAALIGRGITAVPWRIVEKEQLAGVIAVSPTDVVVTFGAGNIENQCAAIAAVIERKIEARS
jgi:UDP-N-acetylmuramate--alanine ligase